MLYTFGSKGPEGKHTGVVQGKGERRLTFRRFLSASVYCCKILLTVSNGAQKDKKCVIDI